MACMARWPGKVPARSIDARQTLTFDLTASILAAAGCQPSERRPPDGIDVLGHIVAGKSTPHRPLFWRARRADRTWKAVRDRNLKYVWRQDGEQTGAIPIFDLSVDPNETRNLIDTMPRDTQQLKDALAAWEARMKANR